MSETIDVNENDSIKSPSTPGQEPTAGGESLEAIGDTIANSQPEVNPDAGTPSGGSQASAAPAGEKLIAGIPESQVARDKDGNIKYKKDGVTPQRKRGRGASSKIATKSAEVIKAEKDQQKKMMYRQTGDIAGNFLISISMLIGGEEFAPLKDERTGVDERLAINDAFASYFEATNKEDIPPGWALVMVISGYMIPRFAMPKTKERAVTLWDKFKLWREDRRIKKAEKLAKLEKEKEEDNDQ